MDVEIIKVGMLECNCYILTKGNDVLVIDPGDDFEKINNKLKSKNVLGILITHHHPDHIGALISLKNAYNTKVFDNTNLEQKEYIIGSFTFEVINTPGHTSDSISFYFKDYNLMFVGDFLFKGSIGRCDLPTGNINVMKQSIDMIKKYDDSIVIYSGHGDSTILGNEKKYNMYFKEEEVW